MINEIPILTLPIKPSSYNKIGMYLAPLLSNVLANKINGKSITFLNLLNSYKEQTQYIPLLLNKYKELGITTDCILSDIQMQNDLYEKIYSLVQKQHIYIEKKEIVTCSCGKIDCLKESLESQTGKTNYTYKDIPVCQFCHEKCEIIEKDVLLLKIPPFSNDKNFYFPTFSTKEIIELNNKFQQKEILISKQRNTGLPFYFQDKIFNLDVDFFWANYTSLWNNKQKIILGSQHSIYPLYLINSIQKLHDPQCETFSILLPYIQNKHNVSIMQEYQSLEDKKKQILYLLYSIKFRTKTSDWDENALYNIKKLTTKEIDLMYQKINKPFQNKENTSFRANIINAIRELNIQKNIQDIKKLKNIPQNLLFLRNNDIFHQ